MLPSRNGCALAISVSLDEFAIGFTPGLLRLPVLPVIALIAAQAFTVTQIGTRLGERARENAERLASAALALLRSGCSPPSSPTDHGIGQHAITVGLLPATRHTNRARPQAAPHAGRSYPRTVSCKSFSDGRRAPPTLTERY
jgi:hypothetical protein